MESIGKASVTFTYQEWGEIQSALHRSAHVVSPEIQLEIQRAYDFARELEGDIQRAAARKRTNPS